MRVQPIHETHSVSVSSEAIRATIDAENLVSVLGVLTNLYSDPIYAVVREYSTNALDSHVAAGNPAPIAVTLPQQGVDSPVFVVRDFGVGLDLDGLRRTYLSYGASTKRDSDEFNGTLGLGSKSGLTYAPLGFQIDAVKDGYQVLAVVAQGDDGVGAMQILADRPTHLGNGVTITIPVQRHDVNRFHDAAAKLFAVWAPGTVEVNGEAPKSIHDEDNLVWLDEDVAIGRYTTSRIIMGSVPYEVDVRNDWGWNVVAKVPMGSVHFTPSREDLHHTDLTNETLATLTGYVNLRAQTVIEEHLNSGTSPWAKAKMFYDLLSALDSTRRRQASKRLRSALPQDPAALTSNGYRWTSGRRNGTNVFTAVSWGIVQQATDIVVVDYPYKGQAIPATVKARLNRYADEQTTNGRYTNATWVLLPHAVDLIDGRPNVMTWDEIVEATPAPPREKGVSGTRTKTVYEVRQGGRGFSSELLDETDGPIVHTAYKRDPWARYPDYEALIPDAQIVSLKANQVDKFVRLHPTTTTAHDLYIERKDAAEKGLTEADKVTHWAKQWSWLVDYKDAVIDDDLRGILNLVDVAPTASLLAAKRFGITIDEPDLFAKVQDRYPLTFSMSNYNRTHLLDDIVLYMNAVAERDAEAAEAVETAEELANAGNAQ